MNNINTEVNYKNKKRYVTAKYPIRQPLFFTGLIWVLSKFALTGKKYKVEKINMEGLKPPYMVLSNHMYFIDFELAAMATFPYRVNNVVNIDGYYRRPWLMELIGAICTRKFTMDLHLVKSIRKVLSRGDILCMYPEARYSPCGITSYIPDSVGMLVKRNKVPVVAILHRGNYLHSPFWNFRKKRKVPLHTTATQILTAEDIEKMSVENPLHMTIIVIRKKTAYLSPSLSAQKVCIRSSISAHTVLQSPRWTPKEQKYSAVNAENAGTWAKTEHFLLLMAKPNSLAFPIGFSGRESK